MRIVFLNPSGQLGGAERSLLDVLVSLRGAEPTWDLHLIATDEGPLLNEAAALGVITHVVRLPPIVAKLGDAGVRGERQNRVRKHRLLRHLALAAPSSALYALKLRRVLRSIAPDLVHTNGLKMHLLGIWTAPVSVPVLWHIHDFLSERPVMSRLLRRHAGRCAGAIANSRSVAADIRAICGDVQVTVVYNGIDLDRFAPTGPVLDLDAVSGLPPAPLDTVRVGLVGTLGRWKGHSEFLRAFALLDADLPIRGYVVGGPLYQTRGSQYDLSDLREQAKRLGIQDRMAFTGFVDDASAAMRALDIVVHASTRPEPFGLVIAEGMACGRAVVVSEAGGASELFSSGETALGHPPGDVEALSGAIRRLVLDPELRCRLGTQGRLAAERDFDRRRLAAELVPVYRAYAAAG